LMANWTIINVVGAASWSGAAVAIQSVNTATGLATTGNVVYWPQTATPEPTPNNYTADALLRSADVYDATPVLTGAAAVTAAFYDLPDMSTPYTLQADGAPAVVAPLRPLRQAIDLTSSIAATSATNEFLTDTSISASTDWVFSLPTRRYSMAMDYASIGAGDDGRRFTDLFQDVFTTAYFNPTSTLVSSRQICVIGTLPSVYNREEGTTTSSTEVVVSPSEPAAPLSYCGEASVLSINNGGTSSGSGALKASVALKDLDEPYRDGWMTLTTFGATPVTLAAAGWRTGLPVLGASFVKAWAGANSFGASYPHRFTR